jgi:formyltetrahydrofolate synthetase
MRSQSQASSAFYTPLSYREKLAILATKEYDADGIQIPNQAQQLLDGFEQSGYGGLPILFAKTQLSRALLCQFTMFDWQLV